MKRYKPTTPGRRGMTSVTYRGVLTESKPQKSLTKGGRRGSGRNSFGRITTRHKGGGHKRRFRDVDFKMDKVGVPARIDSVEYDPYRSGFIGLLVYADGEKRYTLLPQDVKVGDTIIASEDAEITPGNRLPLRKIPVGTFVYNIEIQPRGGAKLARSAGNFAEVQSHDAGYTQLKMPSTEIRKVLESSWASVGEVSNSEHGLVKIGKAGRNRWKGIRPTVRGMAMNPVDHPMGGGEARGRGRRKHKKTKQGKIVDPGKKSRRANKYSDKFIVSRRKSKKRK